MEPLASVAQLRLNMKPERDNFTIPKILADVVFEEIVIVLGKNQVCCLLSFCPVYSAISSSLCDICSVFDRLNTECSSLHSLLAALYFVGLLQ